MTKPLRKRPAFWIAIVAVALLVGIPTAIGTNYFGRYTGLTIPEMTPEENVALLGSSYEIALPDGDGPFPTVLMFSGCDGPADNLDTWSERLVAEGWATVVIDSHNARGFDNDARWRLICAGQLLTGSERAGDVAVAVDAVRKAEFADPDRIALLGASHGGWAILEYLAMADQGQVPPTLTNWPEDMADDPLEGVAGAVLLYPFCGRLSRAARHGWDTPVDVLFLLAENDRIASEKACLRIADREAGRGLPVETHIYADVTHGFDQREKAPMSALRYDDEATADALDRGIAFLDDAFAVTTAAR